MFYGACSRLNSCRLGSYLATWSGHVIVHMETDSGSACLSNASLIFAMVVYFIVHIYLSWAERWQTVISHCALHAYSHSMSRRDGRGMGEVGIITKSKSMSGCGSVNVCALRWHRNNK